MANPSKRKGDRYELEAARLCTDLFGREVRRKLGAGRTDDTGDLEGINGLTIQVKAYRNISDGVQSALKDSPRNQANAGDPFGVAMVRIRGGGWAFVMTPEQFADLIAMHITGSH
ncbi:MAG: hypothetical protein OEW83_22535 [Acidimicrobiia bacterium]|nr:hypothetical protein [Acidimicrobiia bacterium]